ncbi:hypothetical protein ACWCXH_15745 [Kitasatospora sp. NPDC001660]
MSQEKGGQGGGGTTRPISAKSAVEIMQGVAQVDFTPSAVSAPFGGPAFTWPFVVTTLLFPGAVPEIPRLRRV